MSYIRLAQQEGQTNLFLQLKGSASSLPQERQATRENPCAKIPQRR